MVGLGETKLRILERLRTRPASAGDLAREFGLSRVAVHRHLADLEAHGLVRARTEKCAGRGRPRQVFQAVDAEAPYARMCGDVLAHLRELYGPDAVFDVLEARNARVKAELEPRMRGRSLKARLEILAEFLTERGYQAEVLREEGRYTLKQRRCPKLALAMEHGELCQAELRLYQDLLGVPVAQECRIAGGCGCCRYRVEEPEG